MALLLQGRGYNLRRGVHFWDGGTSACSHEGGTVAVPLVPVGSTRCRAWTRRSSTRAHPKSRFACAPRRRARRGKEYYPLQRRVCALATITRAGARRERSCALCACAEVRSAYAFASAVATSVGYHSCQSTVEGGTDPLGTCSRSRGGGTINRGGTLNRTKMVEPPVHAPVADNLLLNRISHK